MEDTQKGAAGRNKPKDFFLSFFSQLKLDYK